MVFDMWSSARIAALLAMSVGAVLVPAAVVAGSPAPVRAEASAPVPASAVAAFTLLGQWPAGYVGSITVRNDTTSAINGWRVEFDLAAGTRITSSYGGVFTRTGDHYAVTNETWNGMLAPGSSATFGWVAEGQGTPTNCTLNGADCAGVPVDYTAPTRPGPLTFDISAGLTITWGPSTDDRGTVAYEVYESGRLLTTVTGPRYVYSDGPTLPPRIYVFAVRAVDAAGNPSALSYKSLGQIWRGDEVPGAPSAPRVDTPAAGLLRLAWTGAPISPQPNVPPIAGYEVYLDGELVGQVGLNMIIMSAPPAGRHTFGIRTINAVDQYSTMVELTHVVN
jgi:hypothetical protein